MCDYEGESVVTRLGAVELPAEVEARARSHVPQSVELSVATGEFLLRLAGAEPCALLALFGRRSAAGGAGELEALEIGFESVGLVVTRLPEDYSLVVVLDRRGGGGFGRARRVVDRLRDVLAREIA